MTGQKIVREKKSARVSQKWNSVVFSIIYCLSGVFSLEEISRSAKQTKL